jgi:ABC-type transport system substrate-binding protein
MLFPSSADVNRVWRLVAEAVVDGRLGGTAKVAPADPPNPFVAAPKKQASHLICVYTKDFSDLEDVQRVLEELIELGLAPRNASDGAIYYQADVYTYLDLSSSNPYGLKASLYSSKDIMNLFKTARDKSDVSVPAKRKQQTLTTMLGDGKRRKT